MRRILTVLPVSLAVLVLTALPAAAEFATRPEAGTRGSFGGVLLALILGLLFAVVLVRFAYQETGFGTDSAHHGDATDLPEGAGEHELNA